MSNKQLIKSAHIWFLMVLVAFGLLAVGGQAGIRLYSQNSNQNGNSNSSGNTSTSQNRNANRSANRNSANSNAMSEQAGMGNLNSRDRDFVMDAAIGGMMEVELGRIATQQGMSDSVKQFGQRMVDDHSKANAELTSLAASKGITLPTTLDEKHRAQVNKFSSMSGAEFDRAYTKLMVSDHNKDVSEFEKESSRGTDPQVKAFATQTLPTLKEHLQMAKALEGTQGGNSNSGGSRNSNRNSNNNSNRNSNGNSNSNRP
jgi:putative membrane protein